MSENAATQVSLSSIAPAPRPVGDPRDPARMEKILAVLDEIRPTLRRDSGDVELVDVVGRNIYVKMTGACSGCPLSAMTMGGLQAKLCERLGELVRVVPHELMRISERV